MHGFIPVCMSIPPSFSPSACYGSAPNRVTLEQLVEMDLSPMKRDYTWLRRFALENSVTDSDLFLKKLVIERCTDLPPYAHALMLPRTPTPTPPPRATWMAPLRYPMPLKASSHSRALPSMFPLTAAKAVVLYAHP